MNDYIVNDRLSYAEAYELAKSGQRLNRVFACDITGIMQEYQEACDWISEVVVLSEEAQEDFVLEDWTFKVVGCEDGNILHLQIDSIVVEM